MKAEELKSKIRYAIATSIYSDPTSLGFKGYDNATEKCLKIIEEYARIQIEKDRENSKLLLKQHLQTHVAGYTPCCIEVFKNRPITLD